MSAVRSPRPPTLLDALAPVVVLIALLTLTMVLFGTAAADGPLQIALLLSAAFASLIAFKNGYTAASVRDAAIGGVSSAMGAIFILLAVGALIGTWNLAGTIPTIVSYGLALLRPAIFFATVALICAVVGVVTGSSWTTAATLGVAFVGMAPILGMSTAITAGAVISGAYMGDKMSPLSETTILVPELVGGVTVNEHIRGMWKTVGPSFAIAFLIFLGIGLAKHDATGSISTAEARHALAAVYNISPINLLPLLLLVVLSFRRVPPFLALLGTALISGILASFTQPDVVKALVDEPGQGSLLNGIEAIYQAMATGHVAHSDNETINGLFSRGGMSSMLTTVWLILGALSFAAVMEHAGFLDRLLRPLVSRARTEGRLIATAGLTAIGLNVIAGDQYVADVLPSRAFRDEFARRGLAPRMLSRTVEDTGTVTSPLVPLEQLWRLHGRGARRPNRHLPALRLLQSDQSAARARVRVHGFPSRAPGADRRARRTACAQRHLIRVILISVRPALASRSRSWASLEQTDKGTERSSGVRHGAWRRRTASAVPG